MKIPLFAAALVLCAGVSAADENGFKPLFDGKSLAGWEGDARLWKVRDGAIVGSTEGVKLDKNTFLIYRGRDFGDFVLRAEVLLRNGNSGIQFRSEALPEYVVKGLQADMAENAWWGSIYDERGTRGVIVNGWKGKAETVVKPGEWTSVELRCDGEQIQVRVNGLLTAELRDTSRASGVLALQLHQGPPMQVSFRNLRIKLLR